MSKALSVFAFVALFAAACETTAPSVLTPATTKPVPLSVVLLEDASASFKSASYAGTFNDSPITFFRATSTQLGVLIPATATGTGQQITVVADGHDYQPLTLDIGDAPTIADAETTLQDAITAYSTTVQADETTFAMRTDLAPLFTAAESVLTSLSTSVAALSAADQLTAAQVFTENAPTPAKSGSPWTTTTSADGAALPTDTVVAASATALAQQPITIGAALRVVGDIIDLLGDYGTGTSSAVLLSDGSALHDSTTGVNDWLTFTNGKPLTFPLTLTMSNLSSEDVNDPVTVSQPYVEIFQDLGTDWSMLEAVLPSALGTAPDLTTVAVLTFPIAPAPADVSFDVDFGNVMIDDDSVADAKATVTVSAPACTNGGSGSVTFGLTVYYSDSVNGDENMAFAATLSCS